MERPIPETALVRWSSARERDEEQGVPGTLAEIGRLRAQNAILRDRLTAMEAVALERGGRIDDLQRALRSLPSAWAEHLVRRFGNLGFPVSGWTDGNGRTTECLAQPQRDGARGLGPEPSPQPSRLPGSRLELREQAVAIRARLDRRCREIDQELEEEAQKRLVSQARWVREMFGKLQIGGTSPTS